jgi:hypothetical protein
MDEGEGEVVTHYDVVPDEEQVTLYGGEIKEATFGDQRLRVVVEFPMRIGVHDPAFDGVDFVLDEYVEKRATLTVRAVVARHNRLSSPNDWKSNLR